MNQKAPSSLPYRFSAIAMACALVACGGGEQSQADADATSRANASAVDIAHTVTVRASGTLYNGVGPVMAIRVNGVVLGQFNVTTTPTDYSVNYASLTTKTPVDVIFSNDAAGGGQDRNLLVDQAVVAGTTYLATDARARLDIGAGAAATDGFDTYPGQRAVAMNGALRFNFQRRPNAGLVGNNFFGGSPQAQAKLVADTGRLAVLQRYGFVWGLGIEPNAPTPTGYASWDAWISNYAGLQKRFASLPAATNPHFSFYTNSMEVGTLATWTEVRQKANDPLAPSNTLDPASTWFLLSAAGAPLAGYPGTYAINLTSAAPVDGAGLSHPTWLARWMKQNHFNHPTVGWGVDNLFGNPVQTGNWLRNFNGQGTTQSGTDRTKTYQWPDGSVASVPTQWRKGMAAFYTAARQTYATNSGLPPYGTAPELSGNAEISSTDLSEPEYKGLADSILVETPFDGPWIDAADKRRFWSYEYILGATADSGHTQGDWDAFTQAAAAGHPTAGFANGTSYWKTFNRILTMSSNTRTGKVLVNSYTPRIGATWASDQANLATWRYVLGSCLLMGPRCYPAISPGSTDGIATGPVWWDELSQQIGEPVSAMPTSSNLGTAAYREYEGGLIVLNPTLTAVNVDVTRIGNGQWKRFAGSQAPTINNGANGTTAERIGPKDAVLFVRR